MNINKSSLLALGASLSFTCSSFALVDLNVDSVISGLGQTDPEVNVTPPVAGQTAVFSMSGFEADGITALNAIFEVELINFSNVSSHRVELGQGATGLIGAEIFTDTSGLDAVATYRFSFFEIDGVTALPLETIVQISDIDAVEAVSVDSAGFTTVGLSGTTNISYVDSGPTLDIGAVVNNKPKENPDSAINLFSNVVSSFEITISSLALASGEGREFQFDFNNPPTIDLPDPELIPVPESSSYALLFGLMSIGFVATKRRRS